MILICMMLSDVKFEMHDVKLDWKTNHKINMLVVRKQMRHKILNQMKENPF